MLLVVVFINTRTSNRHQISDKTISLNLHNVDEASTFRRRRKFLLLFLILTLLLLFSQHFLFVVIGNLLIAVSGQVRDAVNVAFSAGSGDGVALFLAAFHGFL